MENSFENLLESVKQSYIRWSDFMENQVEFWKVDGDWHTKPHCSRVLLMSLLLGTQNHLALQEMDVLATAAVFHDSRRQDDWLDVGHGQRAADYYQAYYKEHSLKYDERVYFIMAYHDRDDVLGSDALWGRFQDETVILLYQIFKDADALDRFRLGSNALDVKYLRTEQAKEMVEFAKDLLKQGPEKRLGI